MEMKPISVVCKLPGDSGNNISEKLDALGAEREDILKKEWLSGAKSYKNESILDL